MIKIRGFRQSDADEILSNPIDDSVLAWYGQRARWAKMNTERGPAYTGLIDGKPIAAVGLWLCKREEKNIGWLWAIFTPEIKNCRKSFLRSAKTLLQILVEDFDLDELWTASRAGFNASQRLLEHLGFKDSGKGTEMEYYYVLEIKP